MKTAIEFYHPHMAPFLRELAEMQAWLSTLPGAPEDVNPDRLWPCHALARAVQAIWRLGERGWTVVDGNFDGHFQHTWLETDRFILDVYPVASCGGPVLLDGYVWRKFYVARPDRYAARQEAFDSGARKLLALAGRDPVVDGRSV